MDSGSARRQPFKEPARSGHVGARQLMTAPRGNGGPVQARSGAANRHEHRLFGRSEDAAENRPAAFDEGDANRPVGPPSQIAARPVNGVDDPYAPRCKTRGIVGTFFREPSAVGSERRQALPEQLVDRNVSVA